MAKANGTTLLARMGKISQTVLWNDSCSLGELACSIDQNGALLPNPDL